VSEAKPYSIPKNQVVEAWRQVKANRGGGGVDEETLTMFEANLKDNLYKVWNRMSSGSYFPPPVKRVEIPKKDGRTRKLGIPTVADRVAQAVVKRVPPVGVRDLNLSVRYVHGVREVDSWRRALQNRRCGS